MSIFSRAFQMPDNGTDAGRFGSGFTLNAIRDGAGIQSRFGEAFPRFLQEEKIKAVIEALQEELGPSITLTMPRLTADVVDRLDDEALIEVSSLSLADNVLSLSQ